MNLVWWCFFSKNLDEIFSKESVPTFPLQALQCFRAEWIIIIRANQPERLGPASVIVSRKILGRFSIIYFSGKGLRIRVWIRVSVVLGSELRQLFSKEFDPHPLPRNANNIEPYHLRKTLFREIWHPPQTAKCKWRALRHTLFCVLFRDHIRLR